MRTNCEQIVKELGKLLVEGGDIQPLLDQIKADYQRRLDEENERVRRQEREKRRRDFEVIGESGIFSCWKNLDGSRCNNYHIIRISEQLVSQESYESYDEIRSAINEFADGKCNLDRWHWIPRAEMRESLMKQFGIDPMENGDRFEMWTFDWTDEQGFPRSEVCVYDRVRRCKAESTGCTSNDLALTIKAVFDRDMSGAFSYLRDANELERFTSCKFTRTFPSIYKPFTFHKVNIKVKQTKYSTVFDGYEIDKKNYKLNFEEQKFEEVV